jgi:hypothetical protein
VRVPVSGGVSAGRSVFGLVGAIGGILGVYRQVLTQEVPPMALSQSVASELPTRDEDEDWGNHCPSEGLLSGRFLRHWLQALAFRKRCSRLLVLRGKCLLSILSLMFVTGILLAGCA